MTKVISGFPGVGKSTLFNNGLNCTDSDSSKFDKEDFPRNYVAHIKALIAHNEHDYIFVSSHDTVRAALLREGITYTLVYPSLTLKDEYIKRYEQRGSPASFIKLMSDNWTSFIVSCAEQTGCSRVVLRSGQYLADVIDNR